jgi:hypothetical protein
MSRSVDLFISSGEPLDAVASRIAELAKVEAVPGEGATVVIREGDTSVALAKHRYIDDGDLFLSRYQYVLTGQVPSTARPQDTPVAALLRHVGCALQQGTSWPVLLVLDLQYREPLNAPGGARPAAREASPLDGVEPAK